MLARICLVAVTLLPFRLSAQGETEAFQWDILEHEGVSLGMGPAEAEALLISRGYEKMGNGGLYGACRFTPGPGAGVAGVTFATDGNSGRSCIEGEPIRYISAHYSFRTPQRPLLELLAEAEQVLRSEADCQHREQAFVQCDWTLTSDATDADKVSLNATQTRSPGFPGAAGQATPPDRTQVEISVTLWDWKP